MVYYYQALVPRETHKNSDDILAFGDISFGSVIKFVSYCCNNCTSLTDHFCHHMAICNNINYRKHAVLPQMYYITNTNVMQIYSILTVKKCVVVNNSCALVLPNNIERNL